MNGSSSFPVIPLDLDPTPVEELPRLRDALRCEPRLFVKRDDTIRFAFGGNKVRKMRLVAADALERGADTLITCGGIQSNHARVTAAVAAKMGLRCILVVNGTPQTKRTANALLDHLLGADVRHVADRTQRADEMDRLADEVRHSGGSPYVVPLGASTPLGAAAFVHAAFELKSQTDAPDVIIHSTSSGGTQAGLVTGCAMLGWNTRVIGVSADETAAALERDVRALVDGCERLMDVPEGRCASLGIEVDDRFVGDGYGMPTEISTQAVELCARTEALFLDPTYTAKAMAGLFARVQAGEFNEARSVLFWHTGGQVGLFA